MEKVGSTADGYVSAMKGGSYSSGISMSRLVTLTYPAARRDFWLLVMCYRVGDAADRSLRIKYTHMNKSKSVLEMYELVL